MMPNKDKTAAKQTLGKRPETLPTQKSRVVLESEYREALLACAVLSKFATKKRIGKTDILRFVEILRNRLTQAHQFIILDVGQEGINVTLKLPAASITSLLFVSTEKSSQLEAQFARVCTYLNSPGLEHRLLNLGKKEIVIQSSQMPSNLHHADIKINGNIIVFA